MNVNIKNLKGFRDFLPEEAQRRLWLKNELARMFEKWGYEPLETPVLEPSELFEGQIGEDEKLYYKFKDLGGRDVVMRYDQTVPTCRVISQNYDKLTFPFKRYQIQTAYRAEKPQKGRYREFVQADFDIYGIKSPEADAECITLSIELYKNLGLKNVVALINNRDLLQDIPYPVVAAIDKIRKIGYENVIKEIINKGIKKEEAIKLLKKISELKADNTIETIFGYLKGSGIPSENFRFEPTLARSFSYSQGPIWEIVISNENQTSFENSLGGGERYDALIEKITGRKIFATGFAVGFDRTYEALKSRGLLPDLKSPRKILITVFSPDLYEDSLKLAKYLRSLGVGCEVYPDANTNLDKQLKYADRKDIPFVAILGPEEVKSDTVTIKNMKTQSQKRIFSNGIASIVNG